MDTKPYIRIVFPKWNRKDFRQRCRFVLQLGYINNLHNADDYDWFARHHMLDCEKLYQYYVKTTRVPFVENLIVSFIDDRYVEKFVERNNNMLYVAEVSLKREWLL